MKNNYSFPLVRSFAFAPVALSFDGMNWILSFKDGKSATIQINGLIEVEQGTNRIDDTLTIDGASTIVKDDNTGTLYQLSYTLLTRKV